MSSFIQTKMMAVALVGILVSAWGASSYAMSPSTKTNGFRSAFLGSEVWEDNLSAAEVQHQLQEHFSQVIERLEASKASSLLLALTRAEAQAVEPWTKEQRRAALFFLAGNRRRQIERLRYYMNRGQFPQNEGQSEKAVPIFVDQHQTHCAVGYLMRADGKGSDVASIVNTNNLVYVSDVRDGGMIQWIRSSGLTQEEAALIQPDYPVDFDANFRDLSSPMAIVEDDGLVLSEATFRASRFNATLPTSFQSDPNAIQAILTQGQAAIEANDLASETFRFFSTATVRERNGVLFGSPGDPVTSSGNGFPGNLDRSLYVGIDQDFNFGSFSSQIGSFFLPLDAPNSATAAIFNAGIVEIEYLLRSEQNDFSQIALTSDLSRINGNGAEVEQSALLLLSQIYDGDTDVLLGESQLFSSENRLDGTEAIQLSTDFVRIKTFGLVVDGDDIDFSIFSSGAIGSFFHEFEIAAVPEPGTGSLLLWIGAAAFARRRRPAISN